MTTLANPQTVVLRTDLYSFSAAYALPAGSTVPFFSFGAFLWMGLDMSSWLPTSDPLYYVALYYLQWSYTVTVDTIRTWTIGENGLTVVDSQNVTKVSMTVSDCPITWPSAGGLSGSTYLNAESELTAAGYSAFPSSITYTYTLAAYHTATGHGFPTDGIPIVFNLSTNTTVLSQIPYVAVDPVNTFNTGSQTIQKLIGSQLLPAVNEGGLFDPQTTASAKLVTIGGSYSVGESPSGTPYFSGVSNTNFGLLMDKPNVPLGNLVCQSVNTTAIPALPNLAVEPNSTGPVYVSALADVAGWGGFRYLKLTARISGFTTSIPLPRILLGLVPTSQLNNGMVSAALTGAPTFGIWYEVEATEQGTIGQTLTIDLARPIQGSGTWCTSGGASYSLPDPLGVGMFTNNPCLPQPGGTVGTLTFDTATLVLAVDAGTVVLAP